MEKEFERICRLLEDDAACRTPLGKVPPSVNNMFYDNFGMSCQELQAALQDVNMEPAC